MANAANYDTNMLQKFYMHLSKNKPDFELSSYMQKFSQLKTDLERINFVYSDLRKYNLFPKYLKSKKSDSHAKTIRQNGNVKFAESHYKEAMFCFTESITLAESSEELALSYANRSACLYKLYLFGECIKDIERALALDYPDEIKSKLIERRTSAEQQMKKSNFSKGYYEQIPEILPVRQHPKIQSAGQCVEIQTNEEYGRCVVATKDIKIGEVISVERPFITFLTTARLQHCDFCLELCFSAIPCNKCTLMVYCGENCRKQAFHNYHKFECGILLALGTCGITCFEAIALRVVIKIKTQNQIESLSINDDIYKSDRYKEVHKLNSGNGKFPQAKLLYFSVISSYMIYFLKKYTKFFDSSEDDKYRNLIFLHLKIARLNSMSVDENVYPVLIESVNQIFAFGLYPFSSLFNHSCAPNVQKICYNNTIVLRSVNSIKKGQQCFLSYGVTYDKVKKPARQQYLENYLITCKCKACEQQWDLVDLFSSFKHSFLKELNVSETQFYLMKLDLLQNNVNRAKTMLPNLRNKLKKLEDLEPWNNSALVKNALIKCYRVFGNKKIL